MVFDVLRTLDQTLLARWQRELAGEHLFGDCASLVEYVAKYSKDGQYADALAVHAMAHLLQRAIYVYVYDHTRHSFNLQVCSDVWVCIDRRSYSVMSVMRAIVTNQSTWC
jgi:hypothetical protein